MLHSALPPAEELKLVPLADIARGGMGIVQLCRVAGGRLGGRALAVKRLNPAIEQEPEFVNMFLDETWITSTIASPHVVKVEAWGRDDSGMFLAVELVQGVSLSRLMKESKEKKEPFAERTVANITSQICAGLTAAHELRGENGTPLGLVHRDLTPGNVLCGFDGMVKKGLVSGVAGLAGVVWVPMASSNNRYNVDNQDWTIAPSLAFLLNLF